MSAELPWPQAPGGAAGPAAEPRRSCHWLQHHRACWCATSAPVALPPAAPRAGSAWLPAPAAHAAPGWLWPRSGPQASRLAPHLGRQKEGEHWGAAAQEGPGRSRGGSVFQGIQAACCPGFCGPWSPVFPSLRSQPRVQQARCQRPSDLRLQSSKTGCRQPPGADRHRSDTGIHGSVLISSVPWRNGCQAGRGRRKRGAESRPARQDEPVSAAAAPAVSQNGRARKGHARTVASVGPPALARARASARSCVEPRSPPPPLAATRSSSSWGTAPTAPCGRPSTGRRTRW